MGGHLDDGEPDQDHPILSFSIGLSCIFLIGVESKEIEPLAIKLETGDLVIMSGRSRRCNHGVPKVFPEKP
jgi:alkylated DNA repair protein alkB family protein 1